MRARLLRHPRIWTGVAGSPWTDALLVADGAVTAVGDAARAAAGDDDSVEVVDLPGALVLPGLHDAHIHTEWVARSLEDVDLRHAGSLAETLELIRAHVAGTDPAHAVRGGRWNSNAWDVPVQPHARDLDTVCPDRFAVLDTVDGHSVWVNSAVLTAAGITRDTPDPVGGEIDRDENGDPTGILREAAQDLLAGLPMASAPLRPAMERAQEWLLSLGLTSITDIDGEECRAAFEELHADGALRIRVVKCTRDEALDAAIATGRRSGQGDAMLSDGPVKFFSDGALGSHTAHMTEPYADRGPGHETCGIAVTPYPVLVDRVRTALAAGLDVCTHAIGDEANRIVLDAYEIAREDGYRGILRIEHAQHLRPMDVQRLRSLDVWASMQPTHCTTDIDLAQAIIGRRPVASYAWRTLLDAHVRLAFGSDAPVEEPNPFEALHAAVTRQRADGTPEGGWQPDERITLEEALTAHTSAAHEAVGRTDVGRLVDGQLADLVCVDWDLFDLEQTDPAAIRDAVVLQTWVGGRPVFTR